MMDDSENATLRSEAGPVRSEGSRRRRGATACLASICISVACGHGLREAAAPGEEQAGAGVLQPASNTTREVLPDVAFQLKQRVEQLSNDPGQATPSSLAAAFRALALNVARLAEWDAAEPVRSAADELSGASADAEGGSAIGVRALRAAGNVLVARLASEDDTRTRQAKLEFEAAVAGIDALSTVREESEALLAALRAATNLVYLTHRTAMPFEVTDVGATARRLPPSFCAGVDLAAASVAALARASPAQARARAAEALSTVADALAVLPGAAARAEEIQAIRFEAALVRREGTFSGARALKLGLSRAVDFAAATLDQARADSWLEVARKRVDAIDPGFVAFERAPIQDAFRQVVSALLVAGCCGADCRR